ncbi:MAG: amidoligase family protein [Oleibacter sp.]|nr:amidoligase family protein [Thalassolituus sp.]
MSEQQRSNHEFGLPSHLQKADSDTRRVGFELEFSGINLQQTVAAIQNTIDVEVVSQTEAEIKLHSEEFGDFNIEIDWSYLKSKAAQESGPNQDRTWVELLSRVAPLLVPIEVVCPPIPMDRLDTLLPMVDALRDAGAIGTEESFISAYGVHVNVELPDLEAATLCRYLRAYALLQWWLVDMHHIDIARRISPYIDLFSKDYLKQVLAHPNADMDQIFDDYLQHNPSRNRGLDLLPLLASIDETRVRNVIDDPRIKARPAFHYRLPDCRIEHSEWSLSVPWNSWLVVENLAANEQWLEELSDEFLSIERQRVLLDVSRTDWVGYIDQWLKDHALA